MTWEVEYTDQFYEWWLELDVPVQEKISVVELLEKNGPNLD